MRAAIEIQKTTVEAREWEIRPGLFAIFSTFFRIGLFTLGGGLAMATVMRHELICRGGCCMAKVVQQQPLWEPFFPQFL
jgi:cyanophycinase-like exopeptidase